MNADMKCIIIPVNTGTAGVVTNGLKNFWSHTRKTFKIFTTKDSYTYINTIREVFHSETWSLSGGYHRWFNKVPGGGPATRGSITILLLLLLLLLLLAETFGQKTNEGKTQGVFKKRPNFCYIKTLLLILQHFKHCSLQSSPFYWRYTAPNDSSIVGMLPGTHFLWWRAVLLSHFPKTPLWFGNDVLSKWF